MNSFTHNKQYDIRNSLFSIYNKDHINIVMLGDSITQNVEWNELLGRMDIANRGIDGDTTEGILNRLYNIYTLNPKLCFIMAGINDIGKGIPTENTINNIRIITEIFKEHGIKVIIQSVLYNSKGKYKNWKSRNSKVSELNKQLKKFCEKSGLLFLDVNQILSTNSILNEENTYDGIHLVGKGYEKWKDLIIPIIEERSYP